MARRIRRIVAASEWAKNQTDRLVLGPSEFRDLISGRRRSVSAALLRTVLAGLEVPYTAAVRYRNWRFDTSRATVTKVEVPVISVGNLTLGGTGKTPAVEWLARWFDERGVRVGIVSRGYGTKTGVPNDEALELAEKLPQIPHVLDPDRVRGARKAIDEFGCQLLLLDDGFQHRRLARDFDLVLIDALEPFGYQHVFPRGTLREPLTGWRRASAFMLTRSEMIDEASRNQIRERALTFAPQALWLEATHAPQSLRNVRGGELPLSAFVDLPVAAFCGIGNPRGFRHALARSGFDVLAVREFADHFPYPASEATALAHWVDGLGVPAAICTFKDLVKIGPRWPGKTPLWALSARLELLTGQAAFEVQLEALRQQALARVLR